MTRRGFIGIAPAAALGTTVRAQKSFPGTPYREYSICLPNYLRDLAARAYRARNEAIAGIATEEAVRRRQAWARETFWKLIGGRPEKTPLKPRITGSFERRGYRVEKVLYESRPNLHVPANVYIPTGLKPPFPGVLLQMGHALNGKASPTYQRCAQGLARLGFVVLGFDPMGQGERVYYPDSSGTRTRLPSADDEHTLPGRQMLLVGDTTTRMQVWDAVRSLDYLASHPMVDPARLGATGQSGGGTLTMLLAAVDDRVAAAVVCSGNTENIACANYNPPGSTDDAEQDFVDSGPAAFDRWDTLYPFAPKPLLITVSDKDFFGTYSSNYISNGWEEFGKLKRIYELMGHPERLAWGDTPLPHGLSYDSRLKVYNWFNRWLREDAQPVREEPPVAPEPDRELWATARGNVVAELHGETPLTLARASARRHGRRRLAELLGAEMPGSGGPPRVLKAVPSRGVEIQALEVRSSAKVWLPAWLYLPRGRAAEGPMLVSLEPGGRNTRWNEDGMYQELAARGRPVCVPDVRGIGDLAPEYGRGNPRYARSHADEESYAWASLIFGRPLLGQRASDILALAAALRRHPAGANRKMRLLAAGRLALPALCAAALDPRIDDVYLSGGLVSYASILDAGEYSTPFADFLPSVLEHTDVPEIAASLAPRRVWLAGAVNATGDPVPADAVERLYGGAGNVRVLARPAWDLAVFDGSALGG